MATKYEVVLNANRHPKLDSCDIFSRLAIVSLPFILLAINDNWIFSLPIVIDRWIYSGFHLHLPQFLQTFGDTYYASRLPWTVFGWLLHSVFDDTHALYVLHFAVFYLAVFSLYAAVRTLFANTVAACAAAVLLGTNSYFLVAAGWDYVDGPSMACSLAATAAMASAAVRPRWRLAALMWGVAACAMVSMYLLLVLFVLIQIGMFLLLNRLRGKRPVAAVAALFTAGGVAAMLFFGLINWLVGGPFLYILNQIRVLTAVANVQFENGVAFDDWAWTAWWLFAPMITFAFSCAYVAINAKSASNKIRLSGSEEDSKISLFICCLAGIAASLIYAGLEANHFDRLQMSYFADALFPFAYLTLGGALAVVIGQSGQVRQLGFLAATALIALVPWVLASLGYIFPRRDLFSGPIFESGWIVAGALLVSFYVQRPYHRLAGGALLILFFSIVNLGAPTVQIDYPPNPVFKQQILAVFDASRQVSRYNSDARARFWFDENDPNAQVLQDVVSTYLYEYSLVNQEFPKLIAADGRQSSVAPGERVILLTSRDNDPVALANAAVADLNLLFEQVARIAIRRPGVAFTMVVTDVKLDPSKYEEIPLPQPFAVELPSRIVTPPQPYAYGAQFPLQIQDLKGPLWIRVQASVDNGPFAIGILNRDGSDFLCRTVVAASGDTAVNLLVPKSRLLGDLVIQSWDEGKPTVVTIDTITALKPRSTPSSSDIPADAEEIEDAFGPPVGSNAKLQDVFPARVSTPAEPWTYGARFPLRIQNLKGPLWIRIQAEVLGGPIGIEILDRHGSEFLSRSVAFASDHTTVTLHIPELQPIGDLVIETWAEGKPSDVRVDAITVLKPHSPTAEQR